MFARSHARLHARGDLFRHLALNREDVVHLAVVRLGPDGLVGA